MEQTRTGNHWRITYHLLTEPEKVKLEDTPAGLVATVPSLGDRRLKMDDVEELVRQGVSSSKELCRWAMWLSVKGGLVLWQVTPPIWREFPEGKCHHLIVRKLPQNVILFFGPDGGMPVSITKQYAKLIQPTELFERKMPDFPFLISYPTATTLARAKDKRQAENLWHNLKYMSKEIDPVVADAMNVPLLKELASSVRFGEGIEYVEDNVLALPVSVFLIREDDNLKVIGYEEDLHYLYHVPSNTVLPGVVLVGGEALPDRSRPVRTRQDQKLLIEAGFGWVLGEFEPKVSIIYFI